MFRIRNTRYTTCTLTALILMLIQMPGALSSTDEVESEIRIQANYMRFDMETGNSVYEGAVKISQGGIELNGEKVVIRRKNDEIQQINIDGEPARYIQDEHTDNKIYATSQHMKYIAGKNRLIMTVDARLEQTNHTIESQRIVYDTKNKIVIAGNNKQSEQGGRVNITLTPKKENTETENK